MYADESQRKNLPLSSDSSVLSYTDDDTPSVDERTFNVYNRSKDKVPRESSPREREEKKRRRIAARRQSFAPYTARDVSLYTDEMTEGKKIKEDDFIRGLEETKRTADKPREECIGISSLNSCRDDSILGEELFYRMKSRGDIEFWISVIKSQAIFWKSRWGDYFRWYSSLSDTGRFITLFIIIIHTHA